jgi:hypothetical protein
VTDHALSGRLITGPRVLYVGGSIAAATFPILVRQLPFSVAKVPLFSLFVLSQGIIIGFTIWGHRRESRSRSALLDILCFLAVSLFFLGIVTEYSERTWDWRAYEGAAVAVAQGKNPYTEADYLYPPLLAQAGGAFVRFLGWLGNDIDAPGGDRSVSELLFYLWQCLQFHSVVLCYILGRALLQQLGLVDWRWKLSLVALFVLNVPILRALRFSQPALYPLLAAFLVCLYHDRLSWLAGLSLSIAISLKVFPIVLLLPVFLGGRKRLFLWSIGWLLLFGTASVISHHGMWYWESFGELLRTFPKPLAFRDNSLPNLARNCARMILHMESPIWTGRILQGIVGGWLLMRMLQRRALEKKNEAYQWFGNVSDALMLGLVLSPTVWEHYFVFLIPAIIWAWRSSFGQHPFCGWGAVVLISLIPVFDVFPLSYHRLAGMLVLAWLIPVRNVSIEHREPRPDDL